MDLATPYLLQLFFDYGIPDLHVYTNANDRLVHAYSQACNDQTARAAGAMPRTPEYTNWGTGCIVVSNTNAWRGKEANQFLAHMLRDGTRLAYVYLGSNSHDANDIFARHCAYAPVRVILRGCESNVATCPMIYLVQCSINRIPSRSMDSSCLHDVRRIVRLQRAPSERRNRVSLGQSILHDLAPVELGGTLDWWRKVVDGRSPLLDTTADNMRFLRPSWKAMWSYADEDPPLSAEERCPAAARVTDASPLPDAPNDEFSQHVWKVAIEPNPDVFYIHTALKVDEFEKLLGACPNSAHVDSWMKALRGGLWPWADNFLGDTQEGLTPPNSSCCIEHRAFLNSVRQKEQEQKCWRGPLTTHIPFFRSSPLSVVPKAEGGNRLIQNQSFPLGAGVNDHIPEEEGTVRYDTMAQLAKVIRDAKRKGLTYMSPWKLDVARAFRHIPLHPLFALRNGVTLPSRRGHEQRYIDAQACFGGRAFPRAYCGLADLVCWIAFVEFGCDNLFHYVDDHFGLSFCDAQKGEPKDMVILRKVFAILGIPTNDKFGYGDGLVITGIEVSYQEASFRLSQAKLVRYISACTHSISKESITFQELEHLCGILDHSLQVVPHGKAYMQSLYAAKRRNHGAAKGRLVLVTKDLRESMIWWQLVLSAQPVRYLLQERWWSWEEADEVSYTDASTGHGLGIYRPHEQTGYTHLYDTNSEIFSLLNDAPRKGALLHINTMELLAVVSLVQVVSKEQAARSTDAVPFKLIVMCDNEGVCGAIAKGTADDPVMTALLKDLGDACSSLIDLRVCHVGTHFNPADYLSRGLKGIQEMRTCFPLGSLLTFEPMSLTDYIADARLLRAPQ